MRQNICHWASGTRNMWQYVLSILPLGTKWINDIVWILPEPPLMPHGMSISWVTYTTHLTKNQLIYHATSSILRYTWHQSLKLHHDIIIITLAASHQLTVLTHWQIAYGDRTFTVASLFTLNSLPKHLHNPSYNTSLLGHHLLSTFFFSEYYCILYVRSTVHS